MAEKLVIRAAHIQDSETIMILMREFAAYVDKSHLLETDVTTIEEEVFKKKAARVLIAEADGYPIGYAMFYKTFSSFAGKSSLFLEDLYVTPLFRGKGYGTEMINVLSEIAQEEDCLRLEWRCLKWNKKAQAFYQSIGAKVMEDDLIFRISVGDMLESVQEKFL